MKKSIEKLRKFFRLEADRGYDNKAVMGGLGNILSSWDLEAREDQLSEQIIQAVISRLRDYHQLTPDSREVVLKGIWKRVQDYTGGKDIQQSTAQSAPDAASPPQEKTPPLETTADQPPPPPAAKAPKEPSQPEQPPVSQPPAYELDSPITEVKGIGAKRAQALNKLGINTVNDLLFTFPRRHDDYSQLKTINKLWYGDEVTIIGTVKSVSSRQIHSKKMTLVEAVVTDKSGSLRVTWFNQPWLEKQLSRVKHISLSGEVEQYLGRLTMNNPDWEPLSEEQLHTNRIVPVYPLTEGLNQKWLRKMIHQVLQTTLPQVIDPLPPKIRDQAELIPLQTALKEIHYPEDHQTLKRAITRLAFDEIFLLQMGVFRQKILWESREARVFESPCEWMDQQLARLPYQLTNAQQKALTQIREDLQSGRPMNRLLQGDVGSGKTAVAAMSILIVAEHSAQTALMAPTSILAEQHYQSLMEFLSGEDSPLGEEDIRLLIGSTPEQEKDQIRRGLEEGQIKVVIGTHALLEEPVIFDDLQLAVIDEQHRFGVEQRGTLREKGQNPHLMVMTATPIPRSLALTIYGDLDISIIDQLPPGRQEVETHLLSPSERERAYRLIRGQVDQGNQAFIIYPLVEESDQSDLRAAVEEYERLQREIFSDYSLGLLHGRLHPEQKEETMAEFRNRETQILISTSVIEVGVDIPQATVMLVEGAHRFGLAQLHQFRGRVGRGKDKAYCILIPGDTKEIENKRLLAMTETNDGFKLAELDLKLRGPGQFLGTRQSGYSELSLAKITDVEMIEKARRAARDLIQEDPDLAAQKHQELAQKINQFWTPGGGSDLS
ncbi:MAG: ATP-dependent DNA helicase RecG [Anaerolineales bacterium]|nr:ATP-dependent DNA helicase RecG [Anaerolineales bacterium]